MRWKQVKDEDCQDGLMRAIKNCEAAQREAIRQSCETTVGMGGNLKLFTTTMFSLILRVGFPVLRTHEPLRRAWVAWVEANRTIEAGPRAYTEVIEERTEPIEAAGPRWRKRGARGFAHKKNSLNIEHS